MGNGPAVTPEKISFTTVENHDWKRGGAVKKDNPYIADVKALWEYNKEQATKGEKGRTLQAVVPEADVKEFVNLLRRAGRENGCTVLVDKSNPDKGKVAVRFTARERIVKSKGGGAATATATA